MARQLTADDARQSLNAHVAERGAELHAKYGPAITWSRLPAILADPAFVRYPVQVAFDAAPLEAGEFAWPEPLGPNPADGFRLAVHPLYMTQLDQVPYLVLYQLVAVNYGEFASSDDAETFAAAALGLDREEYYEALCALADMLGPRPEDEASCGAGCGCG